MGLARQAGGAVFNAFSLYFTHILYLLLFFKSVHDNQRSVCLLIFVYFISYKYFASAQYLMKTILAQQ
jgi:hypothetical protein